MEQLQRKILSYIGEDDPEIAEFVINLQRESTSLQTFQESLEEMGGDFSKDFIKEVYDTMKELDMKERIKKEIREKKLPKETTTTTSPTTTATTTTTTNTVRKHKVEEVKEEQIPSSCIKAEPIDDDVPPFLRMANDIKPLKDEPNDLFSNLRPNGNFSIKQENKRRFPEQEQVQQQDSVEYDELPQLNKIYKGHVKNLTHFGAFVQLHGVRGKQDGLVHISAFSRQRRISHPSEIVKPGQECFVKVIQLDNRGKVSLSMREVDQHTGEEIPNQNQTRENYRGRDLYVSNSQDKPIKKRLTSPERWEIRQLIAAGALSAADYPDLDKPEDVDEYDKEEEINIEVKHDLPPFLAGLGIDAETLNQKVEVKEESVESRAGGGLKEGEGALTRAAISGSALARERREMKLKAIREAKQAKLKARLSKPEDVIQADQADQADDALSLEEQSTIEWQNKHNPTKQPISFGKRTTLSIKEQRQSLPVYQMRDQLIQTIRDNQFTVIVGETGSGKTTQLTQYLNESGHYSKMIGCTQPRRVAATSVAKRVAEEMGCRLGDEVGYTIRFEDKSSAMTRIKYMTDGMLEREAIKDPLLSQYDVIMLDEAHERTIATDVLFALLKQACRVRSDLRVIVTSATLNAGKFSEYFNECPVLNIPGRTFEVEVLYSESAVVDYLASCVETVLKIHTEESREGDILVFLTGQEEIETTSTVLEEKMKLMPPETDKLIILPVYSALPSEMQSRIFEPTPKGSRKVILATNIAETSLTIDGIYYVVDPGFAKINAYDPKLGMDSLIVRPISQAQANQRSGRAGRTGPGKCYRLYTELSYLREMTPNTVPEIQRQNLSNTILMLKAIGINDLLGFEFMDPPSRESILLSLNDLYYLGAIGSDSKITQMGKNLVNIPTEPKISKTLLEGVKYGCTEELITIFAMITTPNVFYRPRDKQEQADKRRARFNHPHGDHLTLLNIYNEWCNSGFDREWCEVNFIQERSLKRARDIRNQLSLIFKRFKYPLVSCRSQLDSVRKALCSGFFKNIAKRGREGSYETLMEGTQVYIHPSSSVRSSPQYVLYNSILNTTKEYLVHVSVIEPQWLIEISPDFFEMNGKRTLMKKEQETINPLFNRFAKDQNEWRLRRPYTGSTKKRFRAG